MTSPRYEDVEEADRHWHRGALWNAVKLLSRVIRRADDTDRRLKAISLLGEFGVETRTGRRSGLAIADPAEETRALTDVAVPALIEALSDPDGRVRLRACTALGKIGPSARPAASPLRSLLRDADRLIQGCALRALREIESDSPS